MTHDDGWRCRPPRSCSRPAAEAASTAPSTAAPRSRRARRRRPRRPAESTPPEAIKLGFVTHVLGNPFIQQIIDGANAAAEDLNVDLQVTGPEGGDADAQLKAVQTLVASGVQGVATSVPGETMVERAQRDRRLGHADRAVQPARDFGQGAVRRRALGRERPHPRPEGGREAAGASATGTVIIGNCFPGFPSSRTVRRVSRSRSRRPPGSRSSAHSTSRSRPTRTTLPGRRSSQPTRTPRPSSACARRTSPASASSRRPTPRRRSSAAAMT